MKKTKHNLPAYTIRVSARAKRMALRVSPRGEVELVLPKGMSPREAHAFAKDNAEWLQRTLKKIKHKKEPRSPRLPASIYFQATDQHKEICYEKAENTQLRDRGRVLKVYFADNNQACQVLQHWQQQQAKQILIPWLARVSTEIKLPFNKASIRCQKTRWGSCSAQKNISLNRNLLFFPAEVVRYLLIHELCHTVHLNHSAAYWALVKTFEPNMKRLDQTLRKTPDKVPSWACPWERA